MHALRRRHDARRRQRHARRRFPRRPLGSGSKGVSSTGWSRLAPCANSRAAKPPGSTAAAPAPRRDSSCWPGRKTRDRRLSQSQMLELLVIAYQQPVTQAELSRLAGHDISRRRIGLSGSFSTPWPRPSRLRIGKRASRRQSTKRLSERGGRGGVRRFGQRHVRCYAACRHHHGGM
jgi:hypothetical protein